MDIQHIVHPNLKAPLTCVYTSICESYHPRDLNKESNIQFGLERMFECKLRFSMPVMFYLRFALESYKLVITKCIIKYKLLKALKDSSRCFMF